MKKVVFIANPVSGNGKAKKAAELSASILKDNAFEVSIKFTEYAGHATTLVQQLSSKADIIVAVGGDGTVNEVATGLVGSKTVLGIIPNGSGNGLARHLKIPMSTKKAAECLIHGKLQPLDAPTINDKFFFCTAGVGFDAHISHVFAKMEGRGLKNYIKAILKEYGSYASQDYTISLDDSSSVNQKAFVLTVGNAAQYGNEAVIAPNARIGDGTLELTALPQPNLIRGAIWGIRLFMKNIDKDSSVNTFRGKEIKINNTAQSVDGHRDGEPDTWEYPLLFQVKQENQITVIANSTLV
ncbi:diacylglycerol/lipid kinase family protein [Flammeovirga pacifica]|uniref:DAGKc domain-containing protein n=1 Tax=Flammeovirga pacifica TaxID=915059 RepID=A0A1S1YZN2_FLAPC|nr:YegS/Rv2252/BmrU family lipid kinase [Flammeovirga pacifica]OHX66458.1 hypothetical protein NH26_08865 [Flammeovirga pacifica]